MINSKDGFRGIEIAKEDKHLKIRKRAMNDLLNSIDGDRKLLAGALKIKVTGLYNFIRRGFIPAKLVDNYNKEGFERFTLMVDNSTTTRDKLASGVPVECWSDFVMTDDMSIRSYLREYGLSIPARYKKSIVKETDRLFYVFGHFGVAKIFQVPMSTASNWKSSGSVGSRHVAVVNDSPQLKAALERYGFSIDTLRPDLKESMYELLR